MLVSLNELGSEFERTESYAHKILRFIIIFGRTKLHPTVIHRASRTNEAINWLAEALTSVFQIPNRTYQRQRATRAYAQHE